MALHNQTELRLSVATASGTTVTSTGDKLFHPFGYYTFTARGIACTVTTAIQAADPVTIAVDRRPTAGSDTGRVEVETVTIPGGTAQGKVYYTEIAGVDFVAGEEAVIEVTEATAAGVVSVSLWGEWSFENPANNSDMTVSA